MNKEKRINKIFLLLKDNCCYENFISVCIPVLNVWKRISRLHGWHYWSVCGNSRKPQNSSDSIRRWWDWNQWPNEYEAGMLTTTQRAPELISSSSVLLSACYESQRRSNHLLLGLASFILLPFPGVKRQRREANDSPPTSAEVKKMWIYTSTPLYVFMA
jgi:hypothetical protein